MPFDRPNLRELVTRALADINGRLTGAEARLSVATLNVLAVVQSGAVDGLHGHLDWLADQLMIDRCDEDHLARYASIWKVPRKAAAPSAGFAAVNAFAALTVDAGTLIQRQDGVQYKTTAATNLAVGAGALPVVAVVAGTTGNAAAGIALNLVTPIDGLDSSMTVGPAGITDGAEQETVDAWRARLLERIQEPPNGGTKSDYAAWALEVQGVTRAWVYPNEMGAGTVTVRFMRDNDTNPIPDAAAVSAVAAHLETLRPVTAELIVTAPTAAPINFQFAQLNPNTSATREAIKAELADLLRREAIPGGTIKLSHIRAAISAAAGEDDYVLTAPAANVVNPVGSISTLGGFLWP
ncbi:MAG: baseplate J/gp47 family protein [Herbaspirillum sp.]|uniref:baseplate J/gp47 family protein n=1 Tax=Herbaspirillum sp. TaxID=1890675 RepID=UPI0025840F83|nr:baseplate J/gp47 family protein [Herbaspirillum sp.]MCP3653318.1 baseplate J/gp47 family protein [Herbaspirillum sp.]MCP3946731.1 baseplate J/gp47 family protein [Herbaspirillum sp.]MCP4031207.1 baseplate J/gp47 family protein [Herbaspirillum sp.]MCP4554352.1 baseplate J/gp47 family protein [Herbaspirillum sp.]